MSLKHLNFFCSLVFAMMSFSGQAASAFPRGCEVSGFGYMGSHLVFSNQGKQAFYLLQNVGSKAIELQRLANHEVFMSPSLSAKLSPHRWAALAADVDNLHFVCTYVDTNESVNCRDVIDVCQYPRVKFALSNMGNYWVSINKDQRQVINDSSAKGIYLRW